MRLVGAGGVLVVALALVLVVAPGAHAPTGQVSLTLTSGEFVGRIQDVASRGAERSPEPTPPAAPTEDPAAASPPAPAPEPEPAPAPEAAPAPSAPSPRPQAAAQPAAAAPAAAAAATDPGAGMSAEIVTLTNTERAAAGLPGFSVSECATQQASARAALLVAENRFEHDPLGPILEACRSRTVGENLSLGYASASAAVKGWMNSQGHRENIMRTSFTQIGVACAQGPRGWLCAQVFLG